MKIKIAAALVFVLLVAGALAAIKTLQFRALIAAGKSFVPPPESVSSAVVQEEKWPNTLDAIGSISAVQGVNIMPEVTGVVRQIGFESGAAAAKGDLLLRQDTSSEEAQLRANEAQAEWARISLERARKLRSENTMSQSELDSAEAAWKQAQANADSIRAVIEKKTIRAPFAGRLGIRQVNLGEYLDTGKLIVSLQSVSPVYVDFWLPQQDLARLKTGMPVRLAVDTYPGKSFEGQLTAINPDLDSSTRNVRVQATFDNADELLRPGMFARVQVLLPGQDAVLAIPAPSILSAPFGDSVYVIEAQTNGAGGFFVRQQFIRAGRARGDFVSVESGLKAGQRVVSSGIFKLRNLMPVTESSEPMPKSSTTPKPPEA